MCAVWTNTDSRIINSINYTGMTTEEFKQLEEGYVGKWAKYCPIGRKPIFGMIERMGQEEWKKPPLIIFVIGQDRYFEEEDDFSSLITLI